MTSNKILIRKTGHILFLGRLEKEKNIQSLIGACGILIKEGFLVHLRIVGKGSQEEALREMAGDKKWIKFCPWTDDPTEHWEWANVLCLPSMHESWGRVVIEAVHHGVPVVMTDVGCAGEVIIDGESGWVVPVDNWACLALALHDACGLSPRKLYPGLKEVNGEIEARPKKKNPFWMIKGLTFTLITLLFILYLTMM